MARRRRLNGFINLRVRPSLRERIEAKADEMDITLSDFIRRALDDAASDERPTLSQTQSRTAA